MADQWEYEVIDVDWDKGRGAWNVVNAMGAMEFTAASMVEVFNRMGKAGWEMVGLTSFTGELRGGEFVGTYTGNWEALNYFAIFKRPKS